jgi:hypothetical protein
VNRQHPRCERRAARKAGLRARASGAGTIAALALWLLPAAARASMFHGETLDKIADYISWGVLVIVPIVGIAVFWLVHILPEKVAEQKRHPQAKAIQVLCLLSLFFGGMLWPVAWLWAYSKPVLHKMAYGTDVDDSHGPPPGVGKEPDGTIPVLTTEAEVPAATRAAKQGA